MVQELLFLVRVVPVDLVVRLVVDLVAEADQVRVVVIPKPTAVAVVAAVVVLERQVMQEALEQPARRVIQVMQERMEPVQMLV